MAMQHAKSRAVHARLIWSLVFALALLPAALVSAGEPAGSATTESPAGKLVPAAQKDAAWVAQQRAEYPLEACLVSDENLEGDMGGPVDYVYEQPGKPDVLVRFCCKHCVRDFQKNPQKFLDELVAAKAKKAEK